MTAPTVTPAPVERTTVLCASFLFRSRLYTVTSFLDAWMPSGSSSLIAVMSSVTPSAGTEYSLEMRYGAATTGKMPLISLLPSKASFTICTFWSLSLSE